MAYNLYPLIHTLEDILQSDHQNSYIFDSQLRSLLEKATSLNKIIEESLVATINTRECFDAKIADAAHEAQDLIESYIVDGINCILSPPDLEQVIDQFGYMIRIMGRTFHTSSDNSVSFVSDPSVSNSPFSTYQGTLPGFEKDVNKLIDRLCSRRNFEVIPVAGMGGIGKTFMVQRIYNSRSVRVHFDRCAWVTISPQYTSQAVLLGIIGCVIGNVTDEMLQQREQELTLILHKNLTFRRYLIVLDDVWDMYIWEDIRRFLPDNNNGSRVVITTRSLQVARHACSNGHHQMHLLNEVDSWELLRQIVFVKENCPPELEMIGKTIARRCEGLPLTIYVIGKYLFGEVKEKKIWELVAEDVISVAATKDENFLQVFSVSYDHLRHQLRPCFLYIGSFPGSHKIQVSKLVKLWIAEEILKDLSDTAAECYLSDLLDRSLLFVGEQECGKVKSYRVHSVMRDICIRNASHEKFSTALINGQAHRVREVSSHSIRRVIVHPNQAIMDNNIQIKPVTSFVSTDYSARLFLSLDFDAARLLRTLDLLEIAFREFPEEILKLVNVRYLALTCYSNLPSEISRLWKLQTLIFRVDSDSQSEIPSALWSLAQLRHFKFKDNFCWVEPGSEHTVLEKLQTFSYVDASMFTRCGFVEQIPNIRKLGLCCDLLKGFVDLFGLHRLETLKIYRLSLSPSGLRIPPSVLKLTLNECMISEDFIADVGLLPNLEVLKLRKCSFVDQNMEPTEWNVSEDEFVNLKLLYLEELNLVHIQTPDEIGFYSLERLVIRYCFRLQELPLCIGGCDSLEIIDIDEWSPSAVVSAREILREQRKMWNNYLKVNFHAI